MRLRNTLLTLALIQAASCGHKSTSGSTEDKTIENGNVHQAVESFNLAPLATFANCQELEDEIARQSRLERDDAIREREYYRQNEEKRMAVPEGLSGKSFRKVCYVRQSYFSNKRGQSPK